MMITMIFIRFRKGTVGDEGSVEVLEGIGRLRVAELEGQRRRVAEREVAGAGAAQRRRHHVATRPPSWVTSNSHHQHHHQPLAQCSPSHIAAALIGQ